MTTERPILFSAPMIKALLAGEKTMTRRPVTFRQFQKSTTPGYDWTFRGTRRGAVKGAGSGCWQDLRHSELMELCPYGAPGDRLWCRETFAREVAPGLGSAGPVAYRADCNREENWCPFPRAEYGPWKSSIHMPRALSRITLEICSVRVERLQNISEADAKAEGVTIPECASPRRESEARWQYHLLWESIHGAGSFIENPWVWVIEFRQVEA